MRWRFDCARAFGVVTAATAALLAAAPAAADPYAAIQAGAFQPWYGDVGYSLALQILGSNAVGKSRWGGEFEYRNFHSNIVDVPDVLVESYVFRGMWQYHVSPDRSVSPYLGLGFGVVLDVVDDHKVDNARGTNTIGSTSAGLDGLFLVGLQLAMPGLDHLSVYTEGRVGFSFAVYGRKDNNSVEYESLGGYSGSLGLRYRF